MAPFFAAMGQLLFLKKERKAQEALVLINQTSQKLLGLDSTLLSRLSERYLLELLENTTDYGTARCLVMAALVKQEADVHDMLGDADLSIALYSRALRFYLAIIPDHRIMDEETHLATLAEIADKLRGADVPRETRLQLFRLFDRIHRYAEAENVLYDMLDQDPADADAMNLGIDFYERLLGLHPARLLAGKLPREEAEAGLLDMRERLSDLSMNRGEKGQADDPPDPQ